MATNPEREGDEKGAAAPGEQPSPRGEAAANASTAEPGGRELLLVRHAKASKRAEVKSDFDRPLTRRGRRDAPRIARWIRTQELVPDVVVSSPSCRTRETTELVVEELMLNADDVRMDERLYEADVPTLLRVLAECPLDARRVLLVGHNPGLEELVRHLGGADVPEPEKGKFFPTSALARLRVDGEWSDLGPGKASLVLIAAWSRKARRWKLRVAHGEERGG